MANRKAATMVQPPVSLVPPTGWTPDEKRFAQQLDSIIKDIYRRWGRLGLTDLSIALRGAFDRTVSVDDFESIFKQTADSLSVQFGTPDEVLGTALEISRNRLYARVLQSIDLAVVNASGKVISRIQSNGESIEVNRLKASDVDCPTLVKWTNTQQWLPTQSKTMPGAFAEILAKLDGLEQRVAALENPPEEA